LAQSSHRLI